MTDDKTPSKTSVSSPDEEPKKAKPAASPKAEPAKRAPIAYGSVVSGGDTDPIKYSSAKPSPQKKVLTVLHVQRALADLGYAEAASAPGGQYEALTRAAVSQFQASRNEAETGVLTRDQFSYLFEGDPNVDVSVDTHEDHQV